MAAQTLPRDWQLQDGTIRLRPFRFDDAAPFYAMVDVSREVVGRWLAWCNADYDMGAAEQWVARCIQDWPSGQKYACVIEDVRDGSLLGGIGLMIENSPLTHHANLGYWLRSDGHGRGVMTRAARMLAEFGLRELGLPRVHIYALADNIASRRVAEKAGFQFEGVLRRYCKRPDGSAGDSAWYSLIAEDLQ